MVVLSRCRHHLVMGVATVASQERVRSGSSCGPNAGLAPGMATAPACSPAASAGQCLSLAASRAGSSGADALDTGRALAGPADGDPFSCRFSVDEGLTWSTHNFTSTSVFVDGLLSEPGDETLVMT